MRQLSPPSSLSQTPAAEIPTASRWGSPGHGQMECSAKPPAPGFHSGRVGTFQSARFSSHVSPESVLTKSAAGATPAYSTPSASPGCTIHTRSIVVSGMSSGNAGPFDCSHSPLGSSVYMTRGP